ncbi:hypothetical protein BT93_L2814 [Corymbia citriodora subsp. variegata]|uniref:Uncharacterized protein n=1 Tax=Corymbia citriodora subsp. variegata TaxID=360336 RepID=A0A8T0CN41_CORYI|nr:hypothetical protein BT93_L2814 [Corymbia citriodora subsp. variegata]
MATQYANLANLQGPKSPSSCGENKPIERSSVHHCSVKDAGQHCYSAECTGLHCNMGFGTKKSRSWGRRAQELPRLLGFWNLASSIRYIRMKTKAFYNGFRSDSLEDSLVVRHDGAASLVDPYFAIPVTPPPCMCP